MSGDPLGDALCRRMAGVVRSHEPLAPHTTLRIGGPSRLFAWPQDDAAVAAAVAWAGAVSLPWRVFGLGSNLLCPDTGFGGLVLDLARACGRVSFQGDRLEAGAGVHLAPLIREAARRGLAGLAGVAGVPGTVGGALTMNAGTAAGDMGQVVERVRALDPLGRQVELGRDELRLGYRQSILQQPGWVALSAVLRLSPADPAAVGADLAARALRRRQTQPLELPNAGSIWRNPTEDHAGRLIEAAACKGLRRGDAQVSPKHANFIVNLGSARAADVLALMAAVRRRVAEGSGVRLEPELRWLGGQTELAVLLEGDGG